MRLSAFAAAESEPFSSVTKKALAQFQSKFTACQLIAIGALLVIENEVTKAFPRLNTIVNQIYIYVFYEYILLQLSSKYAYGRIAQIIAACNLTNQSLGMDDS